MELNAAAEGRPKLHYNCHPSDRKVNLISGEEKKKIASVEIHSKLNPLDICTVP